MRVNHDEVQHQAPNIYKVLGAVVLDIVLLGIFWFFLMILASAIWAISEFLAKASLAANAQPGPMALMLISVPTLYLAILALSAWRGRKLVLPQATASTKHWLMLAIATGFALFLLTLLITYALNAAGMALKPTNQVLIEEMGKQWPLVISFFAVVVAPFFEELFFRKQLFARFAAAGFVISGYLLSSLLFALMHEPMPSQGFARWLAMLALYGAMGAVFAWVYKKTGRLWPSIVAHASNNIFAMSALFFGASMG